MFMSNTERLFRNSVFGGFNKEDVIDYIENMKNEFFEYRSQVEETVKGLNKRIATLENEAKAANIRANEAENKVADALRSSKAAEERLALEKAAIEEKGESGDPIEEINLATDRLRRVADEICDNLSSFIDRISENSIAVTIAQPAEEASAFEEAAVSHKETKEEKAVSPDAESILSFIDGILASGIGRKAEEKTEITEKKEPSLLDGLLPDELFS